ncbi:MAG: flagellar biosynthesis protein FlgM [Candidatus Rokuibacteriota bacterium]|nr:MAG: flagellar biosynthesis protein FlgM [Candidatus Rokubacteria bacterium]
MRWTGGRRSDNIEDRRGMGGGTLIAGGGIGSIVLVLLALFFGFDPGSILQTDQPSVPSAQAPAGSPAQDDLREFVSVVLADTEDTWRELFERMGRQYREPKLVLFTSAVESACGMAGAAVGPFYCPSDQKLYLDLSFFRALRDRFRAPGDFAQAYVIAHEVGHHVQTLLGITEKVAPSRQRGGAQGNAASVRVELQADCLAGIWAHHAKQARDILEEGDLEEALNAASAIGDDRLQRQAQGRVAPETFTHGSSRQRVHWFGRGFETGELRQCDTFRATEL